MACLVAEVAIGAMRRLEPHEQQGDMVEQAVNRPERTKQSTPRPPREEAARQEGRENGDLHHAWPKDRLPGHGLLDPIGNRGLDGSRGTEAAEEERGVLAEKEGDPRDESEKHGKTKPTGPGGQFKLGRGNFPQQILQEAEGTGPAADKAAKQGTEEDDGPQGDEGECVDCATVGKDADGTSQRGQRARMAMEHRRAESVHAQQEGIEPREQKPALNSDAPAAESRMLHDRLFLAMATMTSSYFTQVGQSAGVSP